MDSTGAVERVRSRLRAAHFHQPDGDGHTSTRRIAESSGVTPCAIRRLERGQPSRLLLSQLLPIAVALNVSLATLVKRADPGPVETWFGGAPAPSLDALSAHLRETLRRRMTETGLGAPRLAGRTRLTRSSVSRYRSGAYEVSLEIFDRMATALGDDIGDWIASAPSSTPPTE